MKKNNSFRISFLYFVLFQISTFFYLCSLTEASYEVVCFDNLFVNKIGQTHQEHHVFSAVAGPAIVELFNGDNDIWIYRASTASVILNNQILFSAKDFKKSVKYLEAKVDLLEGENSIDIKLFGLPRVKFRVKITQAIEEAENFASWPMFQSDPHHSGFSADTKISPSLKQMWSFPTQGLISSSPTVYNGIVYIGSSDGSVYAIDALKGTLKWEFRQDATCYSTAAASNNKVFIASTGSNSSDAYLYALDSQTGKPLWPPLKISSLQTGCPPSSPVIFDNIIYVGSSGNVEENRLYAINESTGNVIWQRQIVDPSGETRKGVFSSPAVTQKNVFIGTWGSCFSCPTLFGFNRLDGTPKWSAIVDTPYIFPAPSSANGLVYVRSGGAGWSGDLIAFEEETGTEIWRNYVGPSFSSGSPSLTGDNLYIASGWEIFSFNAFSGAHNWSILAQNAGTCPNANTINYPFFAIANKLIFVKSNNACDMSKVYAVSIEDGKLLWDSKEIIDNGAPSGNDYSTPSVANGWLYFAVGNTLYAYQSKIFRCIDADFKLDVNDQGGECVVYVRYETNIPYDDFNGEAWTCYQQAINAGYSTGDTPKKSSIIVFDKDETKKGLEFGHVGIVTSINNENITIRDSNWVAKGTVGEHTINMGNYKILGFIHCNGWPD